MNAATWIPLVSVAGAVLGAFFSLYGARKTSRDQADVQHRTISLQEMERALEFTGQQLTDLRARITIQDGQIRELQDQHAECERDKRRLMRDLAELRDKR